MNKFNRSEIEENLKAIVLASGATSTVYCNRPKSAPTKNDFIIAKVDGSIEDMIGYGECDIEFALFAKDVANTKNSAKLEYMYEKLLEDFPLSYENLIFENTPTIVGDLADDYGYNARILNVQTIIKVQ